MIREGLPDEVILEQKVEGIGHGKIGKKGPGRRYSACKGPEVGISEISVM